MTKRIIRLSDIHVDKYDFSGEIDTIIEKLKGLKEAGATRLDVDTDYDGAIEFSAERFETDEEYSSRLAEEEKKAKTLAKAKAKLKVVREASEYANYLKLKKKFEDK